MTPSEDEIPPDPSPDLATEEGGRIPPRRDPRTVAFPLRLSPLERDEIHAAARAQGLTMADYMRRRVLYYTMPSSRGLLDGQTYAVLSQLHFVLRNLGNNLNQLAKSANSGFVPQVSSMLDFLNEIYPPLDELRSRLVQASGSVDDESPEWVEDEEGDPENDPDEAGQA